LDLERRKLYYADAGYGRIGELSMDGTDHQIIVADMNMKPRGIAYDYQNRCAHNIFCNIYDNKRMRFYAKYAQYDERVLVEINTDFATLLVLSNINL
jgi:uncharacterized circularly permuted ATP-grasp superfamily protein